MNVQKVKASDFSRRLVTASCLLVFCSCKSQLEVLGIGEDLVLVGILFLLHGTLDDQRQDKHHPAHFFPFHVSVPPSSLH